MPFYYRRRNPYYYRRQRRWYRRNRTRSYFRRRRRRPRVRPFKAKLKKITVKEWQPAYIRYCSIKGTTCLAYVNTERLPHNSTMYELSITPDHWPGGGCFSVSQYNLDTLFNLHEKCSNWWTQSNVDMPLCRYLGVELKFYQCEYTDYIIKVNNQLPSPSNKLTYPSCHPYMMMMSSHKLIVPSRKNKKRRKPYYKLKIPPPQQLQTKWYFQVDLTKTPLLQIHASATNLNHMFARPQNNSNCITFYSLNTDLIQNRQMSTVENTSWPYKYNGTRGQYLYYYDDENPPKNGNDCKILKLIPLTNIKQNTPGRTIYETNPNPQQTEIENFLNNYQNYWGNIFNEHYREHNLENFYISYKSPENIKSEKDKIKANSNITWSSLFTTTVQDYNLTQLDQPFIVPFQYNPYRDTGQDTKCYLLQNSTGTGWEPPSNPDLILDGFPLWLILWGFQDFQIKLKKYTNIEKNCIIVIKTHFTQRPTDFYLVPLGKSFREGKSPYNNECLVQDLNMWYPMVQYQEEEINKIVSCGPGVPYMNDCITENISMFYKFKFKWGGCPPKMINVNNPAHQAQYPIPRNESDTNSLQNPASAPETVLYSFDERHGSLTTRALDRIAKDWTTQSFVTSIADSTTRTKLQETFSQLQTIEEEEFKKEKEILIKLNQLREQQQLLRQRIIHIMQNQSQ